MIRFIRGLIYAAFAAVTAAVVLDWLDRGTRAQSQLSGSRRRPSSGSTVDQLDDEARKALLDELEGQI